MKKVFSISFKVFSVLCIATCLAFAFIEGITLFSGDWLLHELKFFAFIKYSLRFLLCLFGVFVGVCSFIKFFDGYMQTFSFTLLTVSFIGLFLFSNGFGFYFLIVTIVHFVLATATNGKLFKCAKKSAEN